MSNSHSTITAPLTSIFTPPAKCSSSWTFEASAYNDVKGGLLLQNAIQPSLASDCFPSGFNQAGRDMTDVAVLSPGACPEGYTTNTRATTIDGTTTASCCLNDYYILTSSRMQGCISTFTGTTSVAARAGGLGKSVDFTTSITVSGTIQMWAQPITIMYQEEELSYYSTTPSSTSTPVPTPSLDSEADEDTDGDGLSAGAKAGIAVGSVAGAFILLGLGFLVWRRRKKQGSQNNMAGPQSGMAGQPAGNAFKPVFQGGLSGADYRNSRSELDGRPVQGTPRVFQLE
ncbi:hypothetical protein BDV18DRAFT_164607 [Aspergillus unguis]